jgi:hypothetical protein
MLLVSDRERSTKRTGCSEEFRATATIDSELDRKDRSSGHRIVCPTLVLWSKGSGLDTWYGEAGGPLDIWRKWASNVSGTAVDGGHFFSAGEPGGDSKRAQALSESVRIGSARTRAPSITIGSSPGPIECRSPELCSVDWIHRNGQYGILPAP